MGQSGSGKSTLMNILGLLDVPLLENTFSKDTMLRTFTPDEQAEIEGKNRICVSIL